MKRSLLILLLATVFINGLHSQITRKSFDAERTESKFKIDGVLDEAEWNTSSVITDFSQTRPDPLAPSSKKTEVWFRYDDEAIYVAAKLYENKEDLFNLLTNRDNGGNADYFGVVIDAYNAGLAGVGLYVTSAGVQRDVLFSSSGGGRNRGRGDSNWNAVWLSNTQIYDDHWTVEMKIPYAVLRFKSSDIQDWGINFERSSRVLNETTTWNPIDPNITGSLNQAGIVKNIKSIKSPTRLFFYPYMSTVAGRSTENGWRTPQLNGGMDVKYGINDAFTLDMTLIPDFSGVRSDDQVLNLSPFEVRFDENRQFFTEGVELFSKAGLFYSRRIGSTPGNITGNLGENEDVTYEPPTAQLINATKVTGRTNGGLGIGFFNAITDVTRLTVEDSETGEIREIDGDPRTNFNVIVLDQNLRNNSSITLTNTNVLREKGVDDANVTGLNYEFFDNSLMWRIKGFGGYSQEFYKDQESGVTDITTGYKYNVQLNKVSGKWRYGYNVNVENDTYNINDLGFQRGANKINNQLTLEYQQFKPQGWFNNYRIRSEVKYDQIYQPRQFQNYGIELNINGQFKNFWFGWVGYEINPRTQNDFFEARTSGYIFKRAPRSRMNFNIFTDGRKDFRIEARTSFMSRPDWDQTENDYRVKGRLRVGERLEFSHQIQFQDMNKQRGYTTKLYDENDDLDAVIFGTRNVDNVINELEGAYIFTNRMGLTFRARHYWSTVEYSKFWELEEDGDLIDTDYTGLDPDTGEKLHDRNFNTFNIDVAYNWQIFAGSEITFVWKRAIFTDDKNTELDFSENFSNTFNAPNFDTFTLRFVYFLDYLNIKKLFAK